MSKDVKSPDWVSNLKILQRAIFELLKGVVSPEDITVLLSDSAMKKYWIRCFTHKSADAKNNYEGLEFYGDTVLGYVFVSYLRDLYKDTLNQHKATLFLNKYMSKKYQAYLASKMGLVDLVRFDPKHPGADVSIREDVFEAFFGTLNNASDDLIQKGMGYMYCFNLLRDIFEHEELEEPEEIRRDAITELKEIYEGMRWGEPNYRVENSDRPEMGRVKVSVISKVGGILGVGYAPTRDEAQLIAAEEALKTLEQKEGIDRAYVEQEKIKREQGKNPEFAKQYRRVELAIAKVNETARAQKRATIEEFKLESVEKVPGTYTFSLNVAYRGADGKLNWKIVKQNTDRNKEVARIGLMKEFADLYKIPE